MLLIKYPITTSYEKLSHSQEYKDVYIKAQIKV